MTSNTALTVPAHLERKVSALIDAFDSRLDARYSSAYSDYLPGAAAVVFVIVDSVTGDFTPIIVNMAQSFESIVDVPDDDEYSMTSAVTKLVSMQRERDSRELAERFTAKQETRTGTINELAELL